jgi:hypothetical protein
MMTDNELLDRRIEQLVVDTVRRELRHRDEQQERVSEYTTYDTPGLTVAVLQSELRRSNERAGQLARDLRQLHTAHCELKSCHDTQSNTLQRKVKQLTDMQLTVTRLVVERDTALHELKVLRNAYTELAKATA